MATAIQVVYSLVLAVLIVLFVVLGARTFFPEPDPPTYTPFPPTTADIYCNPDGTCYRAGVLIEPEDEDNLSAAEKEYLEAARDSAQDQLDYQEDLDNYDPALFVAAMILGVAAMTAGLFLYRRVDALPLGLVLGGLGVIIYGWIEGADRFDESSTAPAFAAVTVGLVVVLGAGYYFLGMRHPSAGD